MSVCYRPRRRLRNEIFSLALVAAVPCAILSAFPFAALNSLPTSPTYADAAALCAFVTLSPAEERAAIASAHVAWQADRNASRHLRTDLFVDALPPLPPREVGKLRTGGGEGALPAYVPDIRPRSQAAPPPVPIAPQDDAVGRVPAFSREDLLELD